MGVPAVGWGPHQGCFLPGPTDAAPYVELGEGQIWVNDKARSICINSASTTFINIQHEILI